MTTRTQDNKRVPLKKVMYLWEVQRAGDAGCEYLLSEAAEPDQSMCEPAGVTGSVRVTNCLAPARRVRRIECLGRISHVVVNGEDGSFVSMHLENDDVGEYADEDTETNDG